MQKHKVGMGQLDENQTKSGDSNLFLECVDAWVRKANLI